MALRALITITIGRFLFDEPDTYRFYRLAGVGTVAKREVSKDLRRSWAMTPGRNSPRVVSQRGDN
jgi:hypothetical protein